jgi:hypothetical protein
MGKRFASLKLRLFRPSQDLQGKRIEAWLSVMATD